LLVILAHFWPSFLSKCRIFCGIQIFLAIFLSLCHAVDVSIPVSDQKSA
jgi:hypothetical protein